MASSRPQPSYTKITHMATYPAINPQLPALTSAGKVIIITGASGGIGRGCAASFAKSGPKALILLGRRTDELAKTADLARATDGAAADLVIETHAVDLRDAAGLRGVVDAVVGGLGGIDVVVHCAGVLAPVQPLVEADPATFMKGYETTLVGTLAVAQAVILANRGERSGDQATSNTTPGELQEPREEKAKEKQITFINLTTGGILFPPFPGMGAYVSSKMAAVKLLEALAAENPHVRLLHVHPGFLRTAMSAELAKTTKLPFEYNDMSLSADFLVWAASPEADFLRGKIVFAVWDVDELKARKQEIMGSAERPGSGELWLGYQGFPRYIGGTPLPGTLPDYDAAGSEVEGQPRTKRIRD